MKPPSLLRSLMSFSSVTMLSRALGLARDIAINTTFGASAATDAFWVAFRIPNFMRRLFGEGSFSTAFVPVLTEVLETRPHHEVKELVRRAAGTLGGVLLVITALGMLFAPQVVTVFAPGYLDQPDKFSLTVDLLRLTFPFLLFVSLTALAASALNAYDRFAIPAFVPVILNLCLIAGALWLAPYFGTSIMALGWAILAAGVLQLLFLVPVLYRMDLLVLPRWGWRHGVVRRIMRLMVPTLFGSSVAQINLLLDTILASLLITGSQTWLAQSVRFLELPLGVFGVALGTVILPALSRHHVGTDRKSFAGALDWGFRMTLLVAIPAMLALWLLAKPLVATLFQHGEFTAFDTRMASMAVVAFVSGLPAYAMVKVLLPAFYARQDTRTPVKAGVTALLANVVLSVAFMALLFWLWAPPQAWELPWLEAISSVPGLHVGMAMAGAASAYVNAGLLWLWLRRDGVYQRRPGWLKHMLRLLLASAAMTVVLWFGMQHWSQWTEVDAWTRIWHLAVLVTAGGLAWLAVLFAVGFRLRELRAH